MKNVHSIMPSFRARNITPAKCANDNDIDIMFKVLNANYDRNLHTYKSFDEMVEDLDLSTEAIELCKMAINSRIREIRDQFNILKGTVL